MYFCGGIEYQTKDGNLHSDICYRCDGENDKELTEDYKDFLHNCLEEWLNNSNGTGIFWVGNPEVLTEN